MNSIRIDTGVMRISINDDPEKIISFNPSDIIFAERFYKLIGEFEQKMAEYEARNQSLGEISIADDALPKDFADRIAIVREACDYVREQIDYLFGEGTSQKAFGDARNMDMFTQFFDGILPFIRATRAEKIAKYVAPKSKKIMK